MELRVSQTAACSIIPQSVYSLFQNEFSTECVLVLPLSIYSILSFPEGLPVAAYVFVIVFPSLLSFPLSFRQLGVLEGSSKWFHILLIRTTVRPFWMKLGFQQIHALTYQCVRLCEFHRSGSLHVHSNTRHVLVLKTVTFWRSTATSYKVSGAIWLRHTSGQVPNARTWRQFRVT